MNFLGNVHPFSLRLMTKALQTETWPAVPGLELAGPEKEAVAFPSPSPLMVTSRAGLSPIPLPCHPSPGGGQGRLQALEPGRRHPAQPFSEKPSHQTQKMEAAGFAGSGGKGPSFLVGIGFRHVPCLRLCLSPSCGLRFPGPVSHGGFPASTHGQSGGTGWPELWRWGGAHSTDKMSRLGRTRTPTRGMPPALLGDPEATPTPIPAYTHTPALEDLGFPGGSGLKNTPANPGNSGSIPGSGKTPCRRKWQPTPVFLTGESQGERSWRATVCRVANSQAQLSEETTKGARAGGRATKRLRPWPAKAWPLPSFPSLRLWCQQDRMGLAEFRNWSQLEWSRKRSPHTWLFTVSCPAQATPTPRRASRSPRCAHILTFTEIGPGRGAWGRLGVQENPGRPPVPWSVPVSEPEDTHCLTSPHPLKAETAGLGGMSGGMVYATLLLTKSFFPECSASQSCLTLCNPMDCSPPGSSVHGIL